MDEPNAYSVYEGNVGLWGDDEAPGAAEDESGGFDSREYETEDESEGMATALMPQGDDLIYHDMKASVIPGAPDMALEEFSRLAAGFGLGETTHYMGAEEREDYRLGVD